jgi:hypothetical protein
MVFLEKDTQEPMYVAYSQHHNQGRIQDIMFQFDSVRRNWSSNEVRKQGDNNIISYVGLGSHANYPNNGNNGEHDILLADAISLVFADTDYTSESGLHYLDENWQQRFIFDSNLPKWITDYQGRWGVVLNVLDPTIDHIHNNSAPTGPYEQDKFNNPIQWAGIDKIGQATLAENILGTIEFTKQSAVIVINQINTTIDETKQLAVDLHDEVISFGKNFGQDIEQTLTLLPHFWDITSDLVNDTFEAEVRLFYDIEELIALGLDQKDLSAFQYIPEQNIWQELPSVVDIQNQLIKFTTTHFSRYAIGVKQVQWQDITEKIKVQKTKSRFKKKQQEQIYKIRLKNQDKQKQDIKGDLRLILESLPENIEVIQSDGQTQDNKPYLDFTNSYKWCRYTGEPKNIPENLQGKRIKNKAIRKKILKQKLIRKKICQTLEDNNPELQGKLEYVLAKGKKTKVRKLKLKVPKRVKFKSLEWRVVNR